MLSIKATQYLLSKRNDLLKPTIEYILYGPDSSYNKETLKKEKLRFYLILEINRNGFCGYWLSLSLTIFLCFNFK